MIAYIQPWEPHATKAYNELLKVYPTFSRLDFQNALREAVKLHEPLMTPAEAARQLGLPVRKLLSDGAYGLVKTTEVDKQVWVSRMSVDLLKRQLAAVGLTKGEVK